MDKAKKKAEQQGKKVMIFFGDGSFSPGGSGYASVPRKPFIRELGIRYPTVITSEYKTSKLCPICFLQMETVKSTDNNKNGDRLRQCTTENVASCRSIDAQMLKPRDRDACGSVGICQKGFYSLLGNPITFYERSFKV